MVKNATPGALWGNVVPVRPNLLLLPLSSSLLPVPETLLSALQGLKRSIMMRHMRGRSNPICLALLVLASLVMTSACALPVIEGVFDDRDFAIFNDIPQNRGQSGEHVLLVFVDTDDTKIRTVSVDLHAVSTLDVGVELDVSDAASDDRPVLEVVEGTLVSEEIEGRGVLMTVGDDAIRARSVSGFVTLSENHDGDLVGAFQVGLDDGGFLDGSFTARD